MKKTLEEKTGLTAFIPTNAACENLGYSALAYLFSDKGKKDLKHIVEYQLSSQLGYSDEIIQKKNLFIESLYKSYMIELIILDKKRGEKALMHVCTRMDESKKHDVANPHCMRILSNKGESRVLMTNFIVHNACVFCLNLN